MRCACRPATRRRTLYKWGDPIGHPSGSPAFRPDAGNTAEEQALQAGMHHDGIHYFPAALRLAQLDARPARDEPRVHRRWPPARRRLCELERRQGAQSAERARLQRDRSGARGRTLERRAPVALCAPHHGRHADAPVGARGRRAGDANGRRSVGHERFSERSTTAPTATRRGARISRAKKISTAISSIPAC